MSSYTLVFTRPSGAQTSKTLDFANDAMAIWSTKSLLSREVISIAIGRILPPDTIEWLGVYDWDGGQPEWTPENA